MVRPPVIEVLVEDIDRLAGEVKQMQGSVCTRAPDRIRQGNRDDFKNSSTPGGSGPLASSGE